MIALFLFILSEIVAGRLAPLLVRTIRCHCPGTSSIPSFCHRHHQMESLSDYYAFPLVLSFLILIFVAEISVDGLRCSLLAVAEPPSWRGSASQESAAAQKNPKISLQL